MFNVIKLPIILSLLLINGCATSPPKNQDNICHIFKQYDNWYEDAFEMEKKWGTPIPLAMAFVKQESAYVHDAAPPKNYVLGFIPWGRVSSAYGYAQAINATWDEYEKATDYDGSRSDFFDALQFIGWYTSQTHKLLGIAKVDVYNHYLAYHEGRAGYKKGSYNAKPWLKKVAQNVNLQAKKYQKQLLQCRANLEYTRRNSWF